MRIARRRSSNPEIPLVSTSDVAFLLLIFFLSTAALNVERGLLLDLPRPGDAPAEVAESRLVTIEGAGHLVDMERPAELARAVVDFAAA